MIEIYQLIFALIAAGCLTSIQIRRIIKGELPPYGLKAFSAASKINLDGFDKLLVTASGIAFAVFIILTLASL